MITSATVSWILALLALVSLCAVLSPRWRRRMRWGRTRTSIPMTTVGAWACFLVLLLMAIAAFGLLPFWLIFLSVPILACAGAYDYHVHAKKKLQQSPHPPPAPGRAHDCTDPD